MTKSKKETLKTLTIVYFEIFLFLRIFLLFRDFFDF